MFGVLECTIGWFGKERVDYLTYDTNGMWRCYEVKVSKSDFHSNAHNTFIGHYNYYVMPDELYQEVKNEIPNHVGVIANGSTSVKKAKKQELKVDEQVLKDSMMRSLSREVQNNFDSNDEHLILRYKREYERVKKDLISYRNKYSKLYAWIYDKHGREVINNIL